MMEDFFGNLIFALIIIAVIVGVIAVDKWLGSFWGFLLGLILSVTFIFGAIFVVGRAMGEVYKYRSEVEMEAEKEIADSFNKSNQEHKTEKPNNPNNE